MLVESRRARMLRLTVHADGRVVVTMPRGMSPAYAMRFAQARSQWIADKVAYFQRKPKPLLLSANKRDYRQYKDAALDLARQRLAFFNVIYRLFFFFFSLWGAKKR